MGGETKERGCRRQSRTAARAAEPHHHEDNNNYTYAISAYLSWKKIRRVRPPVAAADITTEINRLSVAS